MSALVHLTNGQTIRTAVIEKGYNLITTMFGTFIKARDQYCWIVDSKVFLTL